MAEYLTQKQSERTENVQFILPCVGRKTGSRFWQTLCFALEGDCVFSVSVEVKGASSVISPGKSTPSASSCTWDLAGFDGL